MVWCAARCDARRGVMLNSAQIDQLVTSLLHQSERHIYGGVKALDELKRVKIDRFPYALIVHSHKRRVVDRGHWFLLYLENEKVSYSYDGYGIAPYSELAKFLRKHTERTFYNRTLHQPIQAHSCGLFAIFVLIKLIRGQKFEKIMQNFYKNPITNNERILRIFAPDLKRLNL